ncbi:MAG: pyridoxamine 5'-phosphate oxidase family protein [Betaproteobacteria bacterium]|nr:pyridoxamine 5'-phosphate oxidase family protein [Betaproteobacteria bacterium]
MSRTTPELPARLLAYVGPGALAVLLTVGEDGYSTVAYGWIAAPDAKRVRFGADYGSATLANLQREGRAALQIVGTDNLVFLVKGAARQLKERIAAAPMKMALWEMNVVEAKDQSWPGVVPAPLAFEWPIEQRDAMLRTEHAVYAEMRDWQG